MTTFKATRALALSLAAASTLALSSAAGAAPGMTGRPDLSAAASNQTTEVRWRGRTAAGVGVGFAAGALIGAAAASAAAPRYYGEPYYGSYGYEYAPGPAYESYGYYDPQPTYYYPRSNAGRYRHYQSEAGASQSARPFETPTMK